MSKSKIPVSRPYINRERAKQYTGQVLAGDWLSPHGPYWEAARDMLGEAFNAKVVLTNSGTSALEAALRAVGKTYGRNGGKILIPAHTCPDVAVAVLKSDFRPVFVDIAPPRLTVTAETLNAAIWSNRDAVGVILVHQYGMPPEAEAYHVALKQGLFIIDDQAECLGACLSEGYEPLSLSDALITSFRGDKPLPVGGGGAMFTRHEGVYGVANAIVGMNSPGQHLRLYSADMPLSYEMPEILCALLCAQLEAYQENIAKRWEVVKLYEKCGLTSPFAGGDIPWKFPVVDERLDGLECWAQFNANRIEVAPPYAPLYSIPFLARYRQNHLPNAEWIWRHSAGLPIYPDMSEEDVARVAAIYHELINEGKGNSYAMSKMQKARHEGNQ